MILQLLYNKNIPTTNYVLYACLHIPGQAEVVWLLQFWPDQFTQGKKQKK